MTPILHSSSSMLPHLPPTTSGIEERAEEKQEAVRVISLAKADAILDLIADEKVFLEEVGGVVLGGRGRLCCAR